jgi:hypothetical protein
MTFDELVDGAAARSLENEQRAVSAAEPLTDEQFNKPVGRDWSVAGVFKHLCLASEPYLDAMEKAIAECRPGSGEVKHSWLGKFLIKASGPNSNSPAPGFLVPPDYKLSKEVVSEWRGHEARFRKLCEMAKGKDLSYKVRNPFIKFLRMNVADMFAVMDVHAERHVGQIMERSRIVSGS